MEASSKEEVHPRATEAAREKTEAAYQELLTTLVCVPGPDGASRASLLKGATDLKRAHDGRFYLAEDYTAPIKWLSIVIFGLLTQIALMLVHIGQRPAMRAAVGLFTVAFSTCLIVMTIFDAPFDKVLSDERAATLGALLKTF